MSETERDWLEGRDARTQAELEAERRRVGGWPLSLEEVQRIVGHLINDGTRDGLILGDLLNSAMGASARRRAALRGETP